MDFEEGERTVFLLFPIRKPGKLKCGYSLTETVFETPCSSMVIP
jgi:hypothetical protein